MKSFPRYPFLAAVIIGLVVACGSGATSQKSPPATEPPATASPEPSPTPQPVRLNLLPSRLVIPSLAIDSPIQTSKTIPYTYDPPPGCPARPEDTDTLVVPESGIATPADVDEGFENRTWIFGHSRWLGKPLLFYSLQDIKVGDEVFVDGQDRKTGETVENRRFVVDGIYLADTDSGETLLNEDSPADIPPKPQVILQTSVREDGAGKQWILNQDKLMAKSTNTVKGDLSDPCKYLLLFVVADAS